MSAPAGPVVRFAPSPTGHLHVGGARTALFNWAYARGRGGRFLLRIEDTDRLRSTDAAERGLLEDLRWLGLDWDNAGAEPRQSQRLALYNDAVERLLRDGHAREDAGAIRFRMPPEDIVLQDHICGEVRIAAGQIEDFVIRKADGYPTYHLGVVVDDAEMGITHVIRGQEHLNNAPKHVALQHALGLPVPEFAHIPLIFNPDGSKMSKRDKAKVARKAAKEAKCGPEGMDAGRFAAFVDGKSDDLEVAETIAGRLGLALPEINVADFRASGYLPEALCNYLALLGWNPGEDIERFDMRFLAERFDMDRVGRSPARFDREKLYRFNHEAIVALPRDEFLRRWRAWCEARCPGFVGCFDPATLARLAEVYQPRARTLAEPVALARFFALPAGELAYDAKAVEKHVRCRGGAGLSLLKDLRGALAPVEPWTAPAIHEALQRFAEGKGLKLADLGQPLRVALTGSTVSPPIDATLEILGRESSLARIDRCLEVVGAPGG